MAGTIVVDRIESDSSYTSTINVASKVNFTGGVQYGGSDAPLSNRNMIHNGHMIICQRSASNTGLTAESFATTDRWSLGINTQGIFTMNNEPSGMTTGEFVQCSNVICTTANTTPPASSFTFLAQGIEGANVQKIKKGKADAEWLTLSFWVKSNKTGTYVIELEDNTNTRTISKAYTVTSANVWEKKILNFPPDTTGTISNTNDRQFRVFFWLGTGTTFGSGTLNTSWNNVVQANRAVGCNRLADTVGNYFAFTGVQLEMGKFATPFEYEDYGTTLQKCQRYYQQATGNAWYAWPIDVASNSGFRVSSQSFSMTMRASPTFVPTYGGTNGTAPNSWSATASGWTTQWNGVGSSNFYSVGGFTATAEI